MAQGMELLDNGTKVFTGPGAAFGTDALLLARFAMPRRKETALDLCSGCGIVSLAWHDAGHRGPCTAVELDADASALCRRAVQETPGAEHITALCTDLRTFCKSATLALVNFSSSIMWYRARPVPAVMWSITTPF